MTDGPLPELPLVLLSHRGPVSFDRSDAGRTASRGAGGLVTALSGLAGQLPDAVWVCAAASAEDTVVVAEAEGRPVTIALQPTVHLVEPGVDEDGPTLRMRMVDVEPERHDQFYGQISNPLLWFLQHNLYGYATEPDLTARERTAFEHGYVAVNQQFADVVVDMVQARGGRAVVLLHDYHFYLVGEQVRRACPDAVLSHFIHIPWPGPDAWRLLPQDIRDRLIHGLLGNDVVAFHTRRFARNFVLCAQELLGLPVDLDALTIHVGDRKVIARSYPISIDVGAIEALAGSAAVQRHIGRLEDQLDGMRLLLRVDRTDPSKNVVRGFRAYGQLLTDHPELAGTITFLALLQPSRQDVTEYSDYLGLIGATVAAVNAQHGREGWQPIDLRLVDDLPLAIAAYTICDVLMVNAVADGMNLVAKESAIVNRNDGVLALSENTGAFEELGDHAVTLYPFDIQQQADALYEALTLPADERATKAKAAADVVRRNDVAAWLGAQLADLAALRPGSG
ncbi:MAG: trehalose-6-phosphate synthase [Actinomycetota bacterium]|nr:trehalose-6-phosphate synthase [Actinomycetota bacterium]